ncbi:MAG: glycosyltransferase family 39 protein, partial [Planctomycetota bacterium]
MLLRALLLLLLTAFAAWPVWTLPDLDGTEGRRVQIALEMAQGDWLVPTLGRVPTWAKPPLHYWLLGLANQWFGSGVLALRLPGVLAAFVAAFVAGELLRRSFGPRAGWIGALGIATAPIVLFEWPSAEIDPVFASFTAISLWCLAVGVARERRALLVVAGTVGGLAVLAKGPPYLVFAAGAWLVWFRHRRLRGLFAYLAPLFAVVLAYYVPMWVTRVAPGEMLAVAGEESLGRLSFVTWHSVRTIPEFWLRAVLVQLPLVLWCFWEWRGARDARMDASDLTLRMCSGAAVVAVAVLTFFPGRPTRYLLPNVLLFTFAVAPAVAHFAAFRGPLPAFANRAIAGVGAVGALALCVLPFVPGVGAGALGLA